MYPNLVSQAPHQVRVFIFQLLTKAVNPSAASSKTGTLKTQIFLQKHNKEQQIKCLIFYAKLHIKS